MQLCKQSFASEDANQRIASDDARMGIKMMNRKVLLIREESFLWTFLMENDEIVEISRDGYQLGDDISVSHQLGNIYIGRVKNIKSNIGAAFIEIEPGLECYYDVSQAVTAIFTKKMGKKPLCIGDELLVQISKEAMKTKAITVTSNLNFTGYYAILTTGNTRIGVSAKLPKKQREEYKELLNKYENPDFGLVLRTNAKEVPYSQVEAEIDAHIGSYQQLKKKAFTRTCFSCLQTAPPAFVTNLKNIYQAGLTEIIVDDSEIYEEIRQYCRIAHPHYLDKLRLYSDKMVSLAKVYRTEQAVEQALAKRVWLKSGGYIVIQYTEALTVIDVNSGKYSKRGNVTDSWLTINQEAAKEVAKQLRLRNISGIIIVDFVNMNNDELTRGLLGELQGHLSKDPIQTTLIGMTALQLVEITRKKIRKPLQESIDLPS